MFKRIKTSKSDLVFIRRKFKTLSKDLFNTLNKIHNVSFNSRIWSLLLKGWLDYYIIVVFYYWKLEKKNKKKLLNSQKIYKLSYQKFLIRENEINNNRISITYIIFRKFFYKFFRLILKIIPKVSINYLLYKSCYNNNLLYKIYGIKFYIIFFYFKFVNLLNNSLVFFGKKDLKKRFLFIKEFEKKITRLKNKSFESYLYLRISKDLPPYVLEIFETFLYKTIDIFKVKKIISSYLHNFINKYEKFWLIKSINKKTKFYFIEYGASFRHDSFDIKIKEKIFDKMITWYETKKRNKKQIYFNPLIQNYPIKKIDAIKSIKQNNLGIILKDCKIVNCFFCRGSSIADSYEILENLKKLKLLLRIDIRKKILLKNPYIYPNKDHPHSSYKKFFLKNSFFFKKKKLFEHNIDFFSKCRIIITVYSSTTLSELIFINKPFVCYFSYSYSNFLKDDLYMVKALERSRILFNSPTKLSAHINKIWDNPISWFYSDKNQEVLSLFKKRYLGIKDNNIIINNDKFKNFFLR